MWNSGRGFCGFAFLFSLLHICLRFTVLAYASNLIIARLFIHFYLFPSRLKCCLRIVWFVTSSLAEIICANGYRISSWTSYIHTIKTKQTIDDEKRKSSWKAIGTLCNYLCWYVGVESNKAHHITVIIAEDRQFAHRLEHQRIALIFAFKSHQRVSIDDVDGVWMPQMSTQ